VECFVALLILVFVTVLVTGFGLGRISSGPNHAYAALASRFGGVYQAGNLFRRPAVRFRYGQTWVTIASGCERGQSPLTRARIGWPLAETELRVVAAGNGPGTSADALDLVVGDEQFDRLYHVQGRGEADARRLLSDGVRWQLDRLRQSFECPELSVCISRGYLTVEKPMRFRRAEDLEQFTQCCLELFDQAMLTCCEGIAFLDSGREAQVIESPVCPVCGEEIDSDMVFCCRCRTPHHLDCWKYTRRCSTYGCRETRYMVPAMGRPIEKRQEGDGAT